MEILWTAIVLNQFSIQKLVRMLSRKNCIEHPRIHCHHVTLTHGKNELPDMLGAEINMTVANYYCDESGECVSVRFVDFDWLYSRVPHITISCAEGVSAAHSIEMLEKQEPIISMPKTPLSGVVKACTAKGWVNLEQVF